MEGVRHTIFKIIILSFDHPITKVRHDVTILILMVQVLIYYSPTSYTTYTTLRSFCIVVASSTLFFMTSSLGSHFLKLSINHHFGWEKHPSLRLDRIRRLGQIKQPSLWLHHIRLLDRIKHPLLRLDHIRLLGQINYPSLRLDQPF